jgi:hypothetical protein
LFDPTGNGANSLIKDESKNGPEFIFFCRILLLLLYIPNFFVCWLDVLSLESERKGKKKSLDLN